MTETSILSSVLLWVTLPAVLVVAAGWRRCRMQNRDLRRRIAALKKTEALCESTAATDAAVPEKHPATADRLREYLKLLDRVITTIPNPIYFKAEGDMLRGCNQAFARQILGMAPEKAIGRRLAALAATGAEAAIEAIVAEGKSAAPENRPSGHEITLACADGQTRDFFIQTAPVADDDGSVLGSVGVMLDVTAKNNAAREQSARQKLQGALETAGAVCHELNQPLQAIMGYADLLAAGIDRAHPDYPWITKLSEDTRRIAGITRKLLNITRYETCHQTHGMPIVDLERASGDPKQSA